MLLIFPASNPSGLLLPPHVSLTSSHWEAQNVPYCINVPPHLAFSPLSLHNSYSSFRSPFDITSSRKPSLPLQGWYAQSLSLTSHLTHCILTTHFHICEPVSILRAGNDLFLFEPPAPRIMPELAIKINVHGMVVPVVWLNVFCSCPPINKHLLRSDPVLKVQLPALHLLPSSGY